MSAPYTAELTVERYLSGVRIDSFLVKHFRNYTPYRMSRIVRAGAVEIDGIMADSRQRVFAGQRVTVRLIEPPDKLLEPEALPLDILFEDEWLIVFNKPAGLLTHPVGVFQSGTLCNALQQHVDLQTPLRGLLRPGIVHRLDRETSGVIAVTKQHLAHRGLSLQFQRDQVSKSYLAIVEGVLVADTGEIDLPIGHVPGAHSVLMSAQPDACGSRRAFTRYTIVERFAAHTLLRADPRTGRNHQIRVHLAAIGHPVVGDEFYGPLGVIKQPQVGASGRETALITRHALHAQRLAFVHPITHGPLEFTAPLPDDFQKALGRLSQLRP